MAHTEGLKLTFCPYSIPVNSLAVWKQCALCAVPLVEAYHFTPTCRPWSAHEPQNKTLSVFSFVENCPLCVWPGRGLSYLSKVDPCIFFFTAVHTGILPLFQRRELLQCVTFLSNRYHGRDVDRKKRVYYLDQCQSREEVVQEVVQWVRVGTF